MGEFGQAVGDIFRNDLCAGATASASEERDERHRANNLLDGNPDTFWCPHEGTERAVIEINLQESKTFDRIVLMEQIREGQRIESFTLEWKDGDD